MRLWKKIVLAMVPLGAVAALVACMDGPRAVQVEDLSAYPSGLTAKEAPMLAKLVKEGKLPPLEQRLPEKPLVAKSDYAGYEGLGVYGGTWRRFDTDPIMYTWKMIGAYVPLVRWKFDCTGLEPGLAESWEFNGDGTVLTMHLRKGVRWSDGHPFTSESFAFYYELCRSGKWQNRVPPWSLVNGKEMTLETPDAYTIVMKFAGPNWLVPLRLANGYWECELYNLPVHYLKQFHPDYNPQYKDLTVLTQKCLYPQNPDLPTLWPWKVKSYERGGYRVVFERNPYYYVTDSKGRQLPYIDTVVSALIPDRQVRVLKMLSGEIDCVFRGLGPFDVGLFARGQREGKFRVLRWEMASGGDPVVLPNWSAPDPVLRDLIRDQRFRQALAYAVDRDKCNQIAWRGMCEPQGATISKESWHFQGEAGQKLFEEWRKANSQFDLGKANQLLDQMGLTRRDEKGYRMRPDGKRLSVVMDTSSSADVRQYNDVALIVAEGWEAIGIETIVYTPPSTEMTLRQAIGKYTFSMFEESEMDLFTFPDWLFPTGARYWHPKTGKWYETGGKEGEAPTGPMKELLDINDQIQNEKDQDRRHELVRKAVRIHIDQGPFVIGTVGRTPQFVIVTSRFHNVPRTGILGPWAVGAPATSFPEQYYIQEGGK